VHIIYYYSVLKFWLYTRLRIVYEVSHEEVDIQSRFKSRTLVLSRVRGSVANNNGFWIGWLNLLALPYNYRKL
jgi:hypothetical protein